MRRNAKQAGLSVCERMIGLYAPYVLVRCAGYTNGWRQAQQIGAYTLVTACLLARELGYALPLGTMVEVVLSVVGPDVVAGAEGEDWRTGEDAPLIADPGMQRITQGVNALERSLREVLVLHYACGLDMEDLGRLLHRPAGQIVTRLRRAERLLTRRLEGLRGERCGAGGVNVHSLLAQFPARLDAGWMQEVADCALEYLARHAGGSCRRHAHGDWN